MIAHSDWTFDRLHQETSVYIAPVDVAPHSTGGAVDLTLIDANGDELDMGTSFNADPIETSNAIYFMNATELSLNNFNSNQQVNLIMLGFAITTEKLPFIEVEHYEEVIKEWLRDTDANIKALHIGIEKGKEKEILTNTGRKRMNINGVYSPIDHEIIYREDDSINGQSTVKLYKQIEGLHPELSCIFIIRDNAKYYSSEVVKEYLKNSRIVEIKLPTYSPNLNLIERLWKFLKKKTLYNKYYSSYIEFKNAIYNFFEKTVVEDREELISLMTEKFHFVSEI